MSDHIDREERLTYDPFTLSDAFEPSGMLLLKAARVLLISLSAQPLIHVKMISFTDNPIHCFNNSLLIAAERSCLRGHFTDRYLPRLLVLILLILTPLTYSSDSTPNFQPDGVSSYSLKTKTSCSVAAMRPNLAATGTVAETMRTTLQSIISGPPVRPSQPSRAPPA